MKTKIVLAVLIVLFVVSFVFFLRIGQQGYQPQDQSKQNLAGDTEESTTSQEQETPNQPADNYQQPIDSDKIPLSELSQHNSLDDCWISYDGKVYDITSYLPRHPGSAGKILPYCGSATEFEEAFVDQHGTSKVSLLMRVGTFIGDFDVMGNIE